MQDMEDRGMDAERWPGRPIALLSPLPACPYQLNLLLVW